jgi:hypothetical protein
MSAAAAGKIELWLKMSGRFNPEHCTSCQMRKVKEDNCKRSRQLSNLISRQTYKTERRFFGKPEKIFSTRGQPLFSWLISFL